MATGPMEGVLKYEAEDKDELEDNAQNVQDYDGEQSEGVSAVSQLAGMGQSRPDDGPATQILSDGVDEEPDLEYDSDHSSSHHDQPVFDDSAFAILQSDISNYLQADSTINASRPVTNFNTTSSPHLPPAVSKFRRPETQDRSNFWFCSTEKWNFWVGQAMSSDKRASMSAMDALRSFHISGLLMETDEGIDAETPCKACSRQSKYTPCTVYANRSSTRCAYCIKQHKSNCFAGPPMVPQKRVRTVSDTGGFESGRTSTPSSQGDFTITRRLDYIPIPQQRRLGPLAAPNRRPETIDPSDFWYVEEVKWNQWVIQASGPSSNSQTNSAKANLRLFSRAGAVMESADSHTNVPACTLCERTGMSCKVPANEISRTCAYCTLRRVRCSNVVPQSSRGMPLSFPQEPSSILTAPTVTTPPSRSAVEPPDEATSRFRRPKTSDTSAFWHCSIQRWDELHQIYATALTLGQENAYRLIQLIDKAGRLMETPEGADAETACSSCVEAGETCRFSAVGRKPNERCAFCKLKYKKCNIPGLSIASSSAARSSNQGSSSQTSNLLIRSDVPHLGSKHHKISETRSIVNGTLLPPVSTASSNTGLSKELEQLGDSGTDGVIKRLGATVSMLEEQVQQLIARDTAREAELQKQSKRVKLMAQNFQRVGADLSRGWKRFLRDEFPDDDDDNDDNDNAL